MILKDVRVLRLERVIRRFDCCYCWRKIYRVYFFRVLQKGAPDDDGFPKVGTFLLGIEQPSSPQAHQGAKSSTQSGTFLGRL